MRNKSNYIIAGIWFVLCLVLLLGAFGKAGVVGDYIFMFLTNMFGVGYYFILLMFGLFCFRQIRGFRRDEPRYISLVVLLIGVVIFVLVLAVIHVFTPENGGIVGMGIAKIFIKVFDIWLAIIILAALIVILSIYLYRYRNIYIQSHCIYCGARHEAHEKFCGKCGSALIKKLILTICILVVLPSITLASWWNPASWSIFSFLFNRTPDVVVLTETRADIVASSTNRNTPTTSVNSEDNNRESVNTITTDPKIIERNVQTTPVKKSIPIPTNSLVLPTSTSQQDILVVSTTTTTVVFTATPIIVEIDKGIPYKGQDGNYYYPKAYDLSGAPLRAPTPPDEYMATSGPMAMVTASSGDMVIKKIQPNIVDKQRLQRGEKIKITITGKNFTKNISGYSVTNTGQVLGNFSFTGEVGVCSDDICVAPDSVSETSLVFTLPTNVTPSVVSDTLGNMYPQYSFKILRREARSYKLPGSSVSFIIPVI